MASATQQQRDDLLRKVIEQPGMTSRALGLACRMGRLDVGRRLPELRALGLVRSERAPYDDLRWYPA